jgi:hypothetical protein
MGALGTRHAGGRHAPVSTRASVHLLMAPVPPPWLLGALVARRWGPGLVLPATWVAIVAGNSGRGVPRHTAS